MSLRRGEWGKIKYYIGNEQFERRYLLADGIYPDWAIFMKTISHPLACEALYVKHQESERKDVERCFGVLQMSWTCVRLSVCVHVCSFDIALD
jgi:hypothetical protein